MFDSKDSVCAFKVRALTQNFQQAVVELLARFVKAFPEQSESFRSCLRS